MIKFWSNNIPFEVDIENTYIKNSKFTKFLGVPMDENLTWNKHVNTLHSKLLSNKRLLLNAKNLLSDTVLQHICDIQGIFGDINCFFACVCLLTCCINSCSHLLMPVAMEHCGMMSHGILMMSSHDISMTSQAQV